MENILGFTEVSYAQEKKGRKIIGFKFKVLKKPKCQKDINERDPNTTDMFTNYTDKQLARAVHSKEFIADYNGWVVAQLRTLLSNQVTLGLATWLNGLKKPLSALTNVLYKSI